MNQFPLSTCKEKQWYDIRKQLYTEDQFSKTMSSSFVKWNLNDSKISCDMNLKEQLQKQGILLLTEFGLRI